MKFAFRKKTIETWGCVTGLPSLLLHWWAGGRGSSAPPPAGPHGLPPPLQPRQLTRHCSQALQTLSFCFYCPPTPRSKFYSFTFFCTATKSHLFIPLLGIVRLQSQYIHFSGSYLYFPRIGPRIWLQQNKTDLFWKYINLSPIYEYLELVDRTL